MEERVLYKSCPLCDSSSFSEHRVGDCSNHFLYNKSLNSSIRWMKCGACGHVFTSGYFSEAACQLIFSKTHESQRIGFGLEENRIVSAKMIDKVLPHVSSGVWMDIGFGNGSLLFTAKEYGFTPVGLDLRKHNVELLRSLGVEAYCSDVMDLKLTEKCSVISMMDVLEHMPFPKAGLAAVGELVKPGGYLLISMPNSESIVWDLTTEEGVNPYWGEIKHYHNFGRSRLYSLLEEVGFSAVAYSVSERYRMGMEVVAKKI